MVEEFKFVLDLVLVLLKAELLEHGLLVILFQQQVLYP